MNIEKEVTQKFYEHLVKPELFLEEIWFEEKYGNVHWNGENNVDDLINGDGDTYSGEVRTDAVEIDGYVLYTLSNDCGGESQLIFKLSNKIHTKDFE